MKREIWHVYPVDDLKEHVTDTNVGQCWCNPAAEEDGCLLTHNSMDGREDFETGKSKTS